ncbi:TPA: hypothetical protein EYP66_24110 [Candidatus Poribacteria bacterium]|nr:hypothetical protein [Candidatus Poribacteria bacterium]
MRADITRNHFCESLKGRSKTMIKEIIRRELFEYLTSFKFAVLMILTLALFLMNGTNFGENYSKSFSEYSKNIEEHRRSIGLGYIVYVDREPNSLGFCVDGGEDFQPNILRIELSGTILPGELGGEEPVLIPPNFEKIDWMLIVKALFSLFAILLTYDAISGEKEQGTLALVCSNSISIGSILLGKYLAALITLLIPFFIGISIGLLTLEGQLGIFNLFSGEDFIRLGLFIALSIIFISLFILLGLSVSSLTKRSSISLLLLFFIWVMLLFVIPSLSGIIADSISETPSEQEFFIHKAEVVLSVTPWKLEQHYKKKDPKPALAELPSWLPPEAVNAMSGRVYQASQEMIDELQRMLDEGALQFASFSNEYRNAIWAKQKLARNIARISPSAVFQYAAEKSTHSGFPRELYFFSSAKDYYGGYRNYISSEVGERIPYHRPYLSSIWTVNIDGKEITIRVPYPKLPEKDIPQFSEKKPSISIYESLSDIALLFLWNVMVFFIGFIAFIRYDVRAQ